MDRKARFRQSEVVDESVPVAKPEMIPFLKKGKKWSQKMVLEACRKGLEELGGEVAGFALAVWARDGGVRTAYFLEEGGRVTDEIMPAMVGFLLERHVKAESSIRLPDDDPDDETYYIGG
jgi:hypothetical protein